MNKLILYRYLLFGLVGIEVILMPFLIGEEIYGQYEYYKNISFLTPFLIVGAGTGYVIIKTESGQSLTTALLYALFLGVILSFIIINVFGLPWVLVVASASVLLSVGLESLFKAEQKFLLAMLFKPLLAIMSLVLVFIFTAVEQVDGSNIVNIFVAAMVTAVILYLLASIEQVEGFLVALARSPFYVSDMLALCKKGVLINVSTAAIAIILFMDRHLIRDSFPEQLASYSLAYNLSQFCIIGVTMFTFVNQVEIGLSLKAGNAKEFVTSQLKRAFMFLFAGSLVVFAVSYCMEIMLGFGDLFKFTFLQTAFFGAFMALSSVSVVLVYLERYAIVPLLLFVVMGVRLAIGPLFDDGLQAVFSTYSMLLLSSVVVTLIAFTSLRRLPE